MSEALLWGVVLRLAQATLQAAPFILTGLIITGMLHRLMGHKETKWMFGSNTVKSLFQSWIIGMLLPGCSLGVIPIVKQLRRSGIAIGTIFAFALSSPLFDPMSLLYGLTLSKPITILAFATFSLVVVTIAGGLFDKWFPDTEVTIEEPPATPYGYKRIIAVFVVMARETVSSSMLFILAGLVGVASLSLALPAGSLQATMAHDNPWSPLLMTAIAIPAYATPMTAMGQLGSMFQHGNSVGAAFILLTLGAGMNLGLLVWMLKYYGWRKTLAWMGLMLGVIIVISYGIERPLYPHDIEPAHHTHAFDVYCAPFRPMDAPPGGFSGTVMQKLRMETQIHEKYGAMAIAFLMLIGLGLKLLDRRWVIESWLTKAPEKMLDVVLPGWVLAGAGFLVIIAASITGCFVYYPEPRETLDEMSQVATVEAFSAAMSGDKEHALHWIPICEGWTRRLQVGTYMRHWELSDYHRMKARVFRDKLELLEHMIEDNDPQEEIRQQALDARQAYARMANAFRDEL